jgi:ABC-type transport system involved in multi-copper enzyme maturation permease subunit
VPIYRQSYRTYDGDVRSHFRWWVMIKQELRVLFRTRMFVGLIIMGYLHVCLRVLQIVTFNTLNTSKRNPIVEILKQAEMFTVSPATFFDFLRMQAALVFICAIFAGAGMICDDYKNNLMEVYFSKPMTWKDYAAGKIMALILIGLSFTAIPGILLVLLHNMLAADMEILRATYWLPLSITTFSLAIVVPCALGVLACSALSSSQRYASIAVFMVLFGDLTVGKLVPDLLHERSYAIIAFPLAINRVGEAMFSARRPLFEISWQWSAVYIGIVCVVSLWLICSRVRRSEIAA